MQLDRNDCTERLKRFDLSGLFTQELGWDWYNKNLCVTVDGLNYELKPVAHKRGMVAFVCQLSKGQQLP